MVSMINDTMMKDHAACDAAFARAAEAAPRQLAGAATRGWRLGDIARHIALEEERLFPAFEESSGMSAGGPTEMMRSEHVQMQPLFAQMRDAAAQDAAAYLDASQALHDILQQHNMKEEQMMYPMLDQSLGAAAAAAMVEECRRALDAVV